MDNYSAFWSGKELEGGKFTLIQSDTDLNSVMDHIGLAGVYRSSITGAIVVAEEGDYQAVFLTESQRPWDLNAVYYALPYYRSSKLDKERLPGYWLEENKFYQRKRG